jgi:hypothetical protein
MFVNYVSQNMMLKRYDKKCVLIVDDHYFEVF